MISLRSLSTRLSLSLLVLFLLFSALAASLLVNSSRSYEQEVTQSIHHDLAAHVVENYLLYKEGKPDYAAAKQTFHDLMILGANFEFYLVDKNGAIVASQIKAELRQKDSINLAPVKDFLKQDKDTKSGLILGDDPQYLEKQKVFSVAPIYQMGEVYGYVYVVIGSQARDALESELLSSTIMHSGLRVLLIAIALGASAILLSVALITQPLRKLSKQIHSIKQGGFDDSAIEQHLSNLKSWQAEHSSEVHVLGNAFYEAMCTLQAQYKNIVSIDELRKELLSHVSHDLRTPLASLLGYLETWELQQETISREQSVEYIATAKMSAQKIATLIEQLFELAYLDGNTVTIKKEAVAIAELVQDVLHKFSILAKEKHIQLDVQPQDSSIIVNADIEKLERVFTNLIENALRHTPDGGSITVNIQKNSALVSIEISDTGIGIPESDLPYVFDPHFKAGNSVRENTAHGGLGLAITKKLLELHDTAISVSSQINKGTTFQFALPAP